MTENELLKAQLAMQLDLARTLLGGGTAAQEEQVEASRFAALEQLKLALDSFLMTYQTQTALEEIHDSGEDPIKPDDLSQAAKPDPSERRRPGIHQGDIFWVPLEDPGGAEPGYTHPHVVIQEDVFNYSRIPTVVVCALTSNIKRAKAPGNVLLQPGEGNLPRQSIVEVSKASSVEKTQLGEYIGSLSQARIDQILAGMQFLQLLVGARRPGEEE